MSKLFDNRQKQSAVVLVLIIAGIIYTTSRTNPDSPEGQVRTAIEEMIASAEARSTDAFKKHLSESFEDTEGRNKDAMIKILFGIFFRYKTISLTTVSMDIEQGTNQGVINVDLTLLMSESAFGVDRGNFQLTFRQEGDRWLLWSAEWEDGASYGI